MNLLHTNYTNKTNFLSPTDNTDFLRFFILIIIRFALLLRKMSLYGFTQIFA